MAGSGRQPGPARGRDSEIARLDAVAAEETGSVVVILGEAGIGKSRLWAHGVDAQRRAGARVLATSCAETETEMPYVGLDDLVGPLLDEHAGHLPDPQRHAVERALLRADHGTSDTGDTAGVDARTVAAGVHGLLAAATAVGHLVLAVDDVQWMDVESDRCLTYAVRRLPPRRLTLLLAAREHSPLSGGEPTARVASLLTASPAPIETLRIGPLTARAARDVVQDRHGVALTLDDAGKLVEDTGGNPLWLLEFARARAAAPATATDVPESLTATLRHRLRHIDPAVVTVASLVAVLGRPRPDAVRAALRADGNDGVDDPGDAELARLLDGAVSAELVAVTGDRVVAAHPLVGAALLADLPPFRRRRAHEHAARTAGSAEERAQHLVRARSVPAFEDQAGFSRAECVAALDDAALSARGRGALVQAVRFAEHALELDDGSQPAGRTRRLVVTAELYARIGVYERARDLLVALDLRSLDDEMFDRATLVLGEALLGADGHAAAQGFLDDLETRLRRDGGARRRLATVATAGADRPLGSGDRLERAERTVADADADGASPIVHSRALSRLALARIDSGYPADDVLDRLAVLNATSSLDTSPMETMGLLRGLALLSADDLDAACATVSATRARFLGVGDHIGAMTAALGIAYVELAAGRPGPALAALDLITEPSRFAATEATLLLSLRTRIHLAADELPAVDALLTRQALTGATGIFRHWAIDHPYGLLALARHDPASAAAHLERFVAASAAAGVTDPHMRRMADLDLAEAYLELGDLSRAAGIADHLDVLAHRTGRRVTRGQERRLRAQIALADGAADARGPALAAVALHERGPRPVELGRSLEVLAEAHRRDGDRDAARAAESRARALFLDSGHVARVRSLDARHAPDPPAQQAPSPLSPAERSVADLVAGGRTNRQAAATLHLSVRTVENHLHNAYRKLGITGRAELGPALDDGLGATRE